MQRAVKHEPPNFHDITNSVQCVGRADILPEFIDVLHGGPKPQVAQHHPDLQR